MFIRNENFRSFIHHYPIVTTILVIHFALWVIISFLPFGEQVLVLGVGSNYDVHNGEYWRVLTPIFLHSSFGHMLFNSFSFILFGPALEKMLGKFTFLCAYLLSGIFANIGTYFVAPINYYHLGSSSAIFGLFGIYLYMVIYRKDLIDRMNAQIVISILVIGLVMTFFRANVNIYAHIFGLLGGLALAPIVLRNAKRFY
ncbi:rhomboid family intramembrane serine protease [Calidifontibacillus erzurumensis]|uniref:rhomboid family intramembrane serine protease n=1 Tax=Calidifontibacillus erzurumensis TaxID=2741433 RepID=UPI0035B51ADA